MPTTEHHQYLIIGAGPSGLQLGYFFKKADRDFVIVERSGIPGSTFVNYPRQRNLISINKKWTGETDFEKNMRWDWNSLLVEPEDRKKIAQVTEYSDDYFPKADVLVKYFGDYAKAFVNDKIHYNTEIVNITKNKAGKFVMKTSAGKIYTSDVLVCGTGFKLPYMPAIPGIELAENYQNMNSDAKDFINQSVLVMGKGNSGFETADNLISTSALIHIASPNPISFAWKTHYVGHLRAVNNNLLDTYQLKSQNAVLDANIKSISKNSEGQYLVDVEYSHAMGETETLVYDRVLNCTGFRFDSSLFDEKMKPATSYKGKFPAETSSWESTNIPNLFFIGALQHERDYKKNTTGFIHGFRYTVRTLFNILGERFNNTPYPRREIPYSVDGLVNTVIERVNGTAALWQQFGFLKDLIIVKNNRAYFLEELTDDYIAESEYSQLDKYFTVSLEFNKVCGDPFAIDRSPVPEKAQESIFLHPVVRQYSKGKLINEIHILEDLYTNWTHPTQHVAPLRAFFEASFNGQTNFTYNARSRM